MMNKMKIVSVLFTALIVICFCLYLPAEPQKMTAGLSTETASMGENEQGSQTYADEKDQEALNTCSETSCVIESWAEALMNRDTVRQAALLSGPAKDRFAAEHCGDDRCRLIANGIGYSDIKIQDYSYDDIGNGLIKITYTAQDFDHIERELTEFLKLDLDHSPVTIVKQAAGYQAWETAVSSGAEYSTIIEDLIDSIQSCNFLGIAKFYPDFIVDDNQQIGCMLAPSEELMVQNIEMDPAEKICNIEITMPDNEVSLLITFETVGKKWLISDITPMK